MMARLFGGALLCLSFTALTPRGVSVYCSFPVVLGAAQENNGLR